MVFAVGDCVVLYFAGCEMAHELFVLEFVEAESVALFQFVVVMLYVGYDASAHLQLHVVGRRVLLLVLIHRLEILSHDGAFGDDVGTEIECEDRDYQSRNHIWPHQSLEAYSCCQH